MLGAVGCCLRGLGFWGGAGFGVGEGGYHCVTVTPEGGWDRG